MSSDFSLWLNLKTAELILSISPIWFCTWSWGPSIPTVCLPIQSLPHSLSLSSLSCLGFDLHFPTQCPGLLLESGIQSSLSFFLVCFLSVTQVCYRFFSDISSFCDCLKKKKSYLLSVSLPIAHICLHLISYQIFVTEPSCLLLFSLTLQAHLSVAFKCSNKVFRKLCSHFIQKVCFSPSLTVTLYRSSWARFAQYRHSVECNKFSDWLERHRLSAWIFYTAVAIALQY